MSDVQILHWCLMMTIITRAAEDLEIMTTYPYFGVMLNEPYQKNASFDNTS